jgi:dTDP-4-amino-4,6-dideoxygalactose transaminase
MMSSKIFCGNPVAQFQSYRQEILEAIQRVCDHGPYILGPEVEAFEAEFAAYHGVKYSVGVGSGTDALVLAMRAFDIGHGDEVITVSHTALPTASAIIMTGATPVLVDIEENFFTMDPSKIESAITSKTKAILPVHLYGQPCDMEKIMAIAREHGLKVIEDCAQAHGALYKGEKVGSMGDAGCFSFYPTKNLGAIGDGGGIITNKQDVAERLKRMRQYGWDKERIAQESGVLSRLDELQAAILRIKLRHLDDDNQKRRDIAHQYRDLLSKASLNLPQERENCAHVYHLYVVKTEGRDALKEKLAEVGIEAGIHYAVPVHHHPGYVSKIRIPHEGLGITDKVIGEILTLPIYPELELKKLGNFKEIINV